MPHFDPNMNALLGLAVTMVFGWLVVPLIIRYISHKLRPLPPPSEATREQWKKLMELRTGGEYIGHVERPIFFAALWFPNAWFLLSSWLVFKLALYWQGVNFAAFPEKPPGWVEVEYLYARRKLGSHNVTTLLVGTGANIVIALIGVAAGTCINW